MGRPTLYSDKLAKLICDRVTFGDTIPEICAEPEMPDQNTVYGWVYSRHDFSEAYARARKARARALVDRGWTVLNDESRDVLRQEMPDGSVRLVANHASVKRDDNKANYLKWMAGVDDPESYGPKQQLEVTGGIELSVRMDAAIARAEQRALEQLRPKIIEAEPSGLAQLARPERIEAVPVPAPQHRKGSESD